MRMTDTLSKEHTMNSNDKVWLVTGAGRGLGADIVRAALAAGHRVVATGRDTGKLDAALGRHERLLTVKLDITDADEARAATEAAVARFGRIDVVVNNAGNFYAGFFEELTSDQVRRQIETLLFGPMNVTRAVLPVMRRQRAGLVLTISSTAGLVGGAFCSGYAAGKFAVEGWMESLAPEIEPFGIATMRVEPGFFRTELLSAGSTTFAAPSIDDYAERAAGMIAFLSGLDGKQPGDPAKLASALVQLAALEKPPSRFVAGIDAMEPIEVKARALLAQIDAHRTLSASLATPPQET